VPNLPDHIVSAGSGLKPVVRPRSADIPDPTVPEWKELTFVRNAYGRVVDVPKWRAAEMIQNEGAKLSNRSEYDQYLVQYSEWTAHNPEKKFEEFQNEVLLPMLNGNQIVEAPIESVVEEPTAPTPDVMAALGQTNEKIDRLTDAIISLVEKQPKPAKSPVRVKKGAKHV
jgi:hypothetical protein